MRSFIAATRNRPVNADPADPANSDQLLLTFAQELFGAEDPGVRVLAALVEADFDPHEFTVRQLLDEI